MKAGSLLRRLLNRDLLRQGGCDRAHGVLQYSALASLQTSTMCINSKGLPTATRSANSSDNPAITAAPMPLSLLNLQHSTIANRLFSTSSAGTNGALDQSAAVEDINQLFVAARDEIEYAKEEAETVYFNESIAEARKAVDACLSAWTSLLSELSEDERTKLQRSMGLKMEQLKAEFDQVSKLHLED